VQYKGYVETPHYGVEIDADGLRQLAADCLATADEIEQLSYPERTIAP
jgi:hypothetical protein